MKGIFGKREREKEKKKVKEEVPPPAPPAKSITVSTTGGWAKSSNRPDDAILALLKTECDKQIQGVVTERKTIAVVKKEEPPKEEPKVVVGEDGEEELVEDGLIFSGKENGKLIIKGGNIVKLVEYLTHPVYSDQKYTIAFMLTFRSFATPNELLELLMNRFSIEEPSSGDANFEKTLKVIRLRVSNVLKYWLSNGFYDFEEDQELLKKLEEFIQNVMIPAQGSGELSPAVNLLKIISKQQNPEERQKERMKTFTDKPPMPHLPKNMMTKEKINPILTYHPEELARQLTLIDYNLFTNIKPMECLNQNWMHKTQKEELAPNILAMIRRFNDVSTWIASEILKCKDLTLRTKVLKHIIEIAEFCKNLNNFNTVMEIISGLQSASVYRLRQTWSGLSKNYVKSFEEMRDLVSRNKNYFNFRQYLHNVNPPCIPYLGMYLTDLTFIEEGNKDLLADGSINFTKRKRLSEVIAEIQTYQYTPYCLEEVAFIKDYLLNVECLPEEQCYQLSLKREPRGGVINDEEQEEDEPFGEMEKIDGYRFDEPDTDNAIVFEKEVSSESSFVPIRCATIVKLVERLTYHKYQDTDFVSTFLMSLNMITTPNDFLRLLEIRYNMPKPKIPSKQQLAQFTKVRLIPVHMRIYNVMKIWITSYISDFLGNDDFIQRCNDTLNLWAESNKQLVNTVESIKKIFAKKLTESEDAIDYRLIGKKASQASTSLNIQSFSADCLAQSLSIIEQSIFLHIKAREVLFAHDISVENAPTFFHMKKNFDLIKNWAASEFLKQNDLDSRVKVLSLLISTADKLIQMKNLNTPIAILSGIKSIQNELENSLLWSYVSPSILNIFKQLEQYYKNPASLKNLEKHSGNPVPVLPHLESYIKQLISIHEKPNEINDLINFEKRRQQFEIYKLWNTYNQEEYSFDNCDDCLNYFDTVEIFSSVDIRKKAESLERVADYKLIDLKNRRIRADSIDDSSLSESPRAGDEQRAIVKSSMMSMLSEEKELIQEIVTSAKRELAKDLMSELKRYTECVRDEIALTNDQLGLPNNAELSSERIINRCFPGSLVVIISEIDREGEIFGWEEEFVLYQVDVDDDKYLVHLTPKVLKSDLSAAFKIFKFFMSKVEGCSERNCVILTSRVTDEAVDISSKFGVSIMSFV